MRIPPILFGSLVLVIFLGTIFGFQAAGVWSVSGKVDRSGNAIQPSADDVDSIKGWMTLEQISTSYNVPLEVLLAQFSLPADTPGSTPIKDLESEEFSLTDLRTWLQGLTSPEPVAPISAEPIEAPEATPTLSAEPIFIEPTLQPTDHTPEDKLVNAKTTFQDLLNWGVPAEAIQAIIGGELPSTGTVVKNYVTGKGLEFSPIKSALQAEVDKTR